MTSFRRLVCSSCQSSERLDSGVMVARLRALGMLRRDGSPSEAILEELFQSMLDKLACPQCGDTALTVQNVEWQDDWGDTVRCEQCNQPIDKERLEVFPDTRRCPSCQRRSEQGVADDDPIYCQHCGGLMSLRKRTGTNLAGYRLVCSECGRGG